MNPRSLLLTTLLSLSALALPALSRATLSNPILFVTQFPIGADFTTIGSVFGNHKTDMQSVGRGGDLMLLYPNGSLRYLTAEAGYGTGGQKGPNAIAVRDPCVDYTGTKAVFSMVVGAPTNQFQVQTYYWQLYEVTNLGQGQTAIITKVANQPANYNNITPVYLSDGSIAFTSDRPRNGAAHLYPQLDEYEEAPTVTGLWRLGSNRVLSLLEPSVSGSFEPIVDSYGRLVFMRWDHLQRDQQADQDNEYEANNTLIVRGTFNFSSELANSVPLGNHNVNTKPFMVRTEVFPETRAEATPMGSIVNGFSINQFFPWMLNQDGTEEETLNHIGRHEFAVYFDRSFNNDSAIREFTPGNRTNPRPIINVLQVREDPTTPGRYYAVDAPEFATHAAGQIIRFDAAPGINPDTITVDYLTPRTTAGFVPITTPPTPIPADATGHFRNPQPLSDGQIIAAHTTEVHNALNTGTRASPVSNYMFRLKRLAINGTGFLAPIENLTPGTGISKTISFWDPDVQVNYSLPLWELSPVEVRARSVPPATGFQMKAPEQSAFNLENVDVNAFRTYLQANQLALIVMRNVTYRDRADKQQPYSLQVPGGVQTVPNPPGKIYDIAHMQFFQGDQIRGIGIVPNHLQPQPGRRMLAQPIHDIPAMLANEANPNGPAGSSLIYPDGSVAMLVPASRPLSWQSTAPNGSAVVRERYWISFQPGEIRVCDGCHGVNTTNQAGQPAAQNVASALRSLLARWRDNEMDLIFTHAFEERR